VLSLRPKILLAILVIFGDDGDLSGEVTDPKFNFGIDDVFPGNNLGDCGKFRGELPVFDDVSTDLPDFLCKISPKQDNRICCT